MLLVESIFICIVISRGGALIVSSRMRVIIWVLGKYFGIVQVTVVLVLR